MLTFFINIGIILSFAPGFLTPGNQNASGLLFLKVFSYPQVAGTNLSILVQNGDRNVSFVLYLNKGTPSYPDGKCR